MILTYYFKISSFNIRNLISCKNPHLADDYRYYFKCDLRHIY